jgi:hypothetical protein
MVSANIVIHAFAPTSSNLHIVAARDRTLPGRQGVAMDQQQLHPATAPRGASQAKHREKPVGDFAPVGIDRSGQQQADPASFATESQPEEGGG